MLSAGDRHALKKKTEKGIYFINMGELGVAGGRRRSQAVAGAGDALFFYFTKNPLLRALHERTMGCDLSTYIFSHAL